MMAFGKYQTSLQFWQVKVLSFETRFAELKSFADMYIYANICVYDILLISFYLYIFIKRTLQQVIWYSIFELYM